MSEEDGPKSAIELAMERLRKEDAEAEVTTRKLTDEEEAAIAEVRSLYDSRIAEQEILHRLLTRSTAIAAAFGHQDGTPPVTLPTTTATAWEPRERSSR